MDLTAIATLIEQHKWVALSALVIGAIVRLLKSDTPLPTVPSAWRPWLALGLGCISGALDAIVNGTAWTAALVGGLVAALTAIAGHDALIASARGGRELGERKVQP